MNNDEELQWNVEAGKTFPGDDLDAKAYQEVFARLRKEPDTNLGAGFAEKVIMRIQDQQQKSSLGDFYWLAGGVFLLVVAMIVAVFFSGFKPGLGFLKGISAYAGVFVFGIAFILFLNRLDKKIIANAGVDQS
jgi:hypothetical protein